MNDFNINDQDHEGINTHISSDDLIAFKQDRLSVFELNVFLEHTSSCYYCSDLLASAMEDDLVSTPLDMKMNILSKSKGFYRQTAKSKRASKQVQLFRYSIKVTAASLAAIILVFSLNKVSYLPIRNEVLPIEITIRTPDQPSLTSSIQKGMDQFSNQILEFSNNIVNKEVIKND